MRHIFYSLLLCSTFCTLSAQYCIDGRFTQSDYFDSISVTIERDVPYGLADHWFTGIPTQEWNSFDIAYPNNSVDTMQKRPLIVLTHGGGFWLGDKESQTDLIYALAKKGFVAVAANYRKGWTVSGDPANCLGDGGSMYEIVYEAMQDMQACLRYLTYNAGEYNIDTAWIFAGGESSGSYAMLNSLFASQEEWNILFPNHETEFGSLNNSVNDIAIDYTIKGIINMWGSVLDTALMNVNELVPGINFYGTSDGVVPPFSGAFQNCDNYAYMYGAASINKYLDVHEIYNVLHRRPDYGHESYDHNYVATNIACFTKSIFCNNCVSYEVEYAEGDCKDLEYVSVSNRRENTAEVYPNPAGNNITIILSDINYDALHIYTATGKEVLLPTTHYSDQYTVDIHSLAPGIYFYAVTGADENYSGSFIKQ